VLWRYWLGGRKGIRSVKNWVVGCWHGYLSGASCRLAYVPADANAAHCLLLRKFLIAFTFLVPAYLGSPGKGPLNGRMYVCVLLSETSSRIYRRQRNRLKDRRVRLRRTTMVSKFSKTKRDKQTSIAWRCRRLVAIQWVVDVKTRQTLVSTSPSHTFTHSMYPSHRGTTCKQNRSHRYSNNRKMAAGK